MTRERLVKNWEAIEGYKNGAEVQYRTHSDGEWVRVIAPCWNIKGEYRVEPKPLLVPFDLKDADQIIGRSIRSKVESFRTLVITASLQTGVGVYGPQSPIHYSVLFHEYEFLDGTPCGKLV